VGQDKLAILFDGKTGDKVGQLDADHKGGIYCVSWNPDSKQVLTASADRTCKIWDVETGKAVTTFEFGAGVDDQQLGCIWQGGDLISIGLNGYLNYLDPAAGKLIKSVHGHMNFITSLAHDPASDAFYSGSYDSTQVRWNIKDASTSLYPGAGHTNQISALSIDGASVYSAGMDDCFGVAPLGEGQSGSRIATDSPARGISTSSSTKGVAVGVSLKSVSLIRGSAAVAKVAVSWTPTSVAISPDGQTAAVGGEDQKVHIFKIAGDSLTETQALSGHTREVSAVAFSPNGKYLATACKNRNIILWDGASFSQVVNGQWCFHTSTINSLSFSPDSLFLASASLDQDIYIWNPAKVMQKVRIALAHRGGVNQVLWLNNNEIATGGQDCCIKTWSVDRAAFA
jgi:WD40 repeat protein